ncbi:hypothetical protein AB205_0112900, partial [Aquarana catesbeiana]
EEQPSEPPAQELASGQNITELCPAPTAASVELQGTSPAEALVTGQRVQDLYPTSVAVLEAQVGQGGGSKLSSPAKIHAPGRQYQRHEGTEEEAAGSPPQWQIHSLRAEEASFLPQRLAGVEDVESPAEVLATGQSATNLCPAPATTVEFQGAGAVGPSLQRQADVLKLLLPTESLATGQSSAGLCQAPTVSLQLQEAGAIDPSAQQQTEPWNVKKHPAEALAAGQRVNDFCPTPTEVNYSLEPRMEIMQTDY